MAVPKLNFQGRPTQQIVDKTVALTYDNIQDAIVQLLDDTERQRFGSRRYSEYAIKTEGYSSINTVAAATSVGNGGLMYVAPDNTLTNRARLIYAFNNIVYLYDITNDTRFELRDIGTIDSKTISFLSGVQTKQNVYFVIGDSTDSSVSYKYSGTSTASITVFAQFTGSISAFAKPTGSITKYASASSTTTTVTSATHNLSNSESITITGTVNYNGTYTTSNVTTNTYDITIVFSSDEATGTWVSNDKTTVTDTAHGLTSGESITISATANYNGTYTVEDIATNTFVIVKAFTVDDATGTWVESTKTTVTSSSHGLQNGNTVTITGTTNVNGTFTISNVATNTFNVVDTFVADDATGTWTSETLKKVTETGLDAGRIISKLDDRIMVAGTGDKNAIVQYSKLSSTATFTIFTNSTDIDGGGLLSGSLDAVTALAFINGIGVVFEENRITSHTIGLDDDSQVGQVKNTETLNELRTIGGTGTKSPKGVVSANNRLYFAAPNEIQEFNPVTGELVSLTKPFRPLLKDFDFSDSSLAYDEKRNLLYATYASVAGIGPDRVFIYSFDTKSWSIDTGKRVNQIFYDPINEKVWGLSSGNNGEIVELYNEGYINEESIIKLSVETHMRDTGDRMRKKRYVSASFILGAVSTTQIFKFEFFVDNNLSPSIPIVTKSAADILATGGSAGGGWAGTVWAGGSPSSQKLGFLHYEHTFFVPDFERLSVRITEESALKSAVGQTVLRFSESTDTINDFS